MNASEVGSEDWWKVVRTMPWEESLQYLNDYRSELMSVSSGTSNYVAAGAKLVKVNAEIKRINVMTDNARYVKAMRMVLTEDQFSQVMEIKKSLERKHGANQ